jgi:hypothetical protein
MFQAPRVSNREMLISCVNAGRNHFLTTTLPLISFTSAILFFSMKPRMPAMTCSAVCGS